MADELNTPTHRWYEPRNNISLPKTDFSAQTIYDSGIQKIDAWINSQPWGSPVPGLFALAEPGVWYDPSDLTTLFQDAAGTTPVAAAGQPVGLMLDKSGNGNHAAQTTAASRPTYGVVPATGRRNLLLWSENPTQAPWATIYASVVAAPSVLGYPMFALTTAQDVTTASYLGRVQQSLSLNTGFYTWTSIQAANTDGLIVLVVTVTSPAAVGGSSGSKPVVFDTATQQFTEQGLGAGGVYGAESLGSGLWKITLTFNVTAAGTVFFQRSVDRNATAGVSGGRSIIIGPSQLETGSTATAYQRVTNAFDVTEAGVQSLSYLSFDGVDDFLVTPTITPGTDKVQVFAGVRRLSDAAVGVLLETSANFSVNNGTVVIQAPNAALSRYSFNSKGTAASNVISTATTAPTTNVLVGIGDIAADTSIMRMDGTQVASGVVDQGTGNYLAYPAYIGRRGGASSPYNGRVYGVILRFGANLDAATISATETWMNTKTGAY